MELTTSTALHAGRRITSGLLHNLLRKNVARWWERQERLLLSKAFTGVGPRTIPLALMNNLAKSLHLRLKFALASAFACFLVPRSPS